MKVSEVFQSDYLKANDLNGQSVTVTIATTEMSDFKAGKDEEPKIILSFRGAKKKFVCNKTNAGTIVGLYGDDMDNWIGKPITLVPREVNFQGKMVMAIRVSLIKPGQAQPAPKQAAPVQPPAPQLPPSQMSEPPADWPPADPEGDSVPFN